MLIEVVIWVEYFDKIHGLFFVWFLKISDVKKWKEE